MFFSFLLFFSFFVFLFPFLSFFFLSFVHFILLSLFFNIQPFFHHLYLQRFIRCWLCRMVFRSRASLSSYDEFISALMNNRTQWDWDSLTLTSLHNFTWEKSNVVASFSSFKFLQYKIWKIVKFWVAYCFTLSPTFHFDL